MCLTTTKNWSDEIKTTLPDEGWIKAYKVYDCWMTRAVYGLYPRWCGRNKKIEPGFHESSRKQKRWRSFGDDKYDARIKKWEINHGFHVYLEKRKLLEVCCGGGQKRVVPVWVRKKDFVAAGKWDGLRCGVFMRMKINRSAIQRGIAKAMLRCL